MAMDDPGDVVELGLLWLKLRASARPIILLTLVFLGLALAYTLVVPPRWEADTVLILPDSSAVPNLSSAVVSQALGANSLGGAAAALGLGSKADPLENLKGILESRSVLDGVSRAIHMKRDKVMDLLVIKPDKDSSEIRISFQSRDQKLAIKAVQVAEKLLRNQCARLSRNRAGRLRTQLADQRTMFERDLNRIETDILNFQSRMRTSPAPSNPGDTMLLSGYETKLQDVEFRLRQTQQELGITRTMAHSIASKAQMIPIGGKSGDSRSKLDELRSKLLETELEQRTQEITGGSQAPAVVIARRKTDLQRKRLETEIAAYLRSVDMTVNSDVSDLAAREMLLKWEAENLRLLMHAAPEELGKFQKMLREQSILTTVLAQVRTELEKARVDETISGTDPVRYVVLDAPGLADEDPVNKRWGRNSAIGLVVGLLIGCFMAIRRPFPRPSGASAPAA